MQERGANQAGKQNKKKYGWVLAALLVILILLLLLTSWICARRLGLFVKTDSDSIFLVPEKPGYSVEGEGRVWGTETSIDLFETQYDGIGRDMSVVSGNGDKVIAPGTENEYTFNLKNTGNVAMDYTVKLDVTLQLEGKAITLEQFPVGVRLRHYSGEYLVGDEDTWVTADKMHGYLDNGTLGVNNYAWYTIEWKWLFEESRIDDHGELQLNISDELDTLIGNITSEKPVELAVSIKTEATPSLNAESSGGVVNDEGIVAAFAQGGIGGHLRLWPMVLLALLILLVAIAAILCWIKANTVDDEEETRLEENHFDT